MQIFLDIVKFLNDQLKIVELNKWKQYFEYIPHLMIEDELHVSTVKKLLFAKWNEQDSTIRFAIGFYGITWDSIENILNKIFIDNEERTALLLSEHFKLKLCL